MKEPSDVLMWVLYWTFGIGFLIGFLRRKPTTTSSAWQIPFALETKEPDTIEISADSSPESDWDEICDAAIDKAKRGDTSARTWVTKHIYKKHEVPKPPKVDKPPREVKKETPPLTSTRVIEDAVMFLCGLGEKKRKVDPIVKDLCTKKKYEKVEDIVKDFYKRS